MNQIDQKLIESWILALESDDYLQTGGQLRSGEGFCCLGVLCEISEEGKWTEDSGAVPMFLTDDGDAEDVSLPDIVLPRLGVMEKNFIIPDYIAEKALRDSPHKDVLDRTGHPSGDYDLSQLNDASLPFEDIAEVLRVYYEKELGLELEI